MERKLLLLGLVRDNEMHGYQINEMLDIHLGSSAHITKPTAYRLLNQMAEDGWIRFREEQVGNRPQRRIYSITPEGEQTFQQILRQCLGNFELPELRSSVCLAYLDQLPKRDAAQLLGQRREMMQEALAALGEIEEHQGSFQLVIDNQYFHLEAEIEWLDEVLKGLT
jgi:DNA-binding PadR family transcriptional regulator